MTIAGNTFTVTQEGINCSYSIAPTVVYFNAIGGDAWVDVTATAGCSWTAVSNDSWITITSGSSGTGNGTVNYSVAQNSSTSSRTGTMTIAGNTFTVSQLGQSCTYSISPTSQSFEASGGSGSVSVTATNGCSWTAVSNASWITVTSGSSGTGNGTVNYSVASNSSTSSRTGTMTIAGSTFTVSQSGATGPPDIAVNPTTLDFGLKSINKTYTLPVTVSNTGTGTLTVTSVIFTGIYASIYSQTNNCEAVAPGASCTVNVSVRPTLRNYYQNAYMEIWSNDPDENPVKVLCKVKGTY